MRIGLGLLRWPPETFWNASHYELTAGLAGYLASKGVKTHNERMSRDEFLNLKDKNKEFLV